MVVALRWDRALLLLVLFRVAVFSTQARSTHQSLEQVFSETCRNCNWRDPCAAGYVCSNPDGGTCQRIECDRDSDCNVDRITSSDIRCQRVGCFIADDTRVSRVCSVQTESEIDYCSIECSKDSESNQQICGVNGITYECEAALRCAGVAYLYSGECTRFGVFEHSICQPCLIDWNTQQVSCPLKGYTCELNDGFGNGRCYLRECESSDDCPNNHVCYSQSCCNNEQKFLTHPPNSICLDLSSDPYPFFCPAVYDPVCGFDGNNYGNSCEAKGTCVHYKGQCKEPLSTNTPCRGESEDSEDEQQSENDSSEEDDDESRQGSDSETFETKSKFGGKP